MQSLPQALEPEARTAEPRPTELDADGKANSTTKGIRAGQAESLRDGTSPIRVLRPRRAAPADAVRPTRAEINLANLRHNLRVLERSLLARERSGPAPAIWGVLKADAYGHGAPAVARTLERAGVAGLCVALLEEGVELRSAGIKIPILVMGGYYGPRFDGLAEILANDLTPVVYDPGQIERIASLARLEEREDVRVHLKVDTGMGRLGTSPRDVDAMLGALSRHPQVRLDGLMTHLACADADDPSATLEQMRLFGQVERRARAMGHAPRVRHAANSAAMLRVPTAELDLVRPGIALFGVAPRPDLAPELRPVMRVRTEIVALREIEAGERIGYGHTWEASRPSQIATVPMGYADGLSRQLSNRGHALVRGRRAPIAGAVSMDLTMIDVTDIPGAKMGDEVVFVGAQEGPLGKDAIGVTEIAEHAGTIAWEVMTNISRRVPRFYREP
jgi:alanine racemase